MTTPYQPQPAERLVVAASGQMAWNVYRLYELPDGSCLVWLPCALGAHYLAPDPTQPGHVVERALQSRQSHEWMYRWPSRAAAEASVEQFARQRIARWGFLGA